MKASNFFLRFTHPHQYYWASDFQNLPSLFLANTYRHTFKTAHVQWRISEHPVQEATVPGTRRKTQLFLNQKSTSTAVPQVSTFLTTEGKPSSSRQ